MIIAIAIVAYLTLSVVAGLITGKVIAYGHGKEETNE